MIAGTLFTACGGGNGGVRNLIMSSVVDSPLPLALCTRAHVDAGGSDGDCIRSLVPGAARLYQERRRIDAGTPSPLRLIDENPDHHARWVHNAARRMAFVDPPTPFTINLRGEQPHRTILEEEFDDDSGLIVNISFAPLFLDGNPNDRDIPPDLIVRKDVVLVISAGNQNPNLGLGHGQQQGEQAIATGRVLFVAGLDLERLRQGVYAIDQRSNSCGWGKVYCVMASYTTPIPGDPDNRRYNGTSFSAPIVSSLLANALLLWPEMTSQQVVQLAQYCARPINADGTLAPWGNILSASEADDIWGQGVFSVECLYASNGALTNPITNQPLRGTLSLRGTSSTLNFADQFGRTYTLSQSAGAVSLSFLPTTTSGFFATKKEIIGVAWQGLAFGFQMEKNGFFGTKGTQDFKIGDTIILMMQLNHRFQINKNFDLNLYSLSAWGQMSHPTSSSLVRKARGHSHQIGFELGYQKGHLKVKLGFIHGFGVIGKLNLGDFGHLRLSPKSENISLIRLSLSF